MRDLDGLKGWIGGAHAAFTDSRFATVVGPLADGDLMAGRWVFRAIYRVGISGAASGAGPFSRRIEARVAMMPTRRTDHAAH